MLGASPELIAAHPMDAHAPDEEIMLVEHAFLSTNPEAFCRIPSFAAWREAGLPVQPAPAGDPDEVPGLGGPASS